MLGAKRISEIKLVEIKGDQIGQRGRLNTIQVVDGRFVALQDHRIDEIRLKNADVNTRVSGGRVPCSGEHASSFRALQIDSQVAGCQRSIRVLRIDHGREWKIALPPWSFRARGFRLNPPRLAVYVSHEYVTKINDLLATPDVFAEKLGCSLQSCPMPSRCVSHV